MEKLEQELEQLQNELRGKNAAELSDSEFAEYCKKSKRVTEIMNELYEFTRVGEN